MKKQTKKSNLIYYFFTIVFGVVGVGLLIFSFNLTLDQINFLKSSSKLVGQVIELREYRSDDGVTYSPVIKYINNGQEETFISKFSSNPSDYRVNEQVTILLSKNNPEPQIDSFFGFWFGPMITFFIGIFFFITSVFTVYHELKERKGQKLLDQYGTKIIANQLVVEQEESRGKRRTYVDYYIKAQWLNPKNNKVYYFYSDYLDYNPKDKLPKDIEVTVLPDDLTVYRMDISWMSQTA